jgi:hypothetical protein
MQPWLLAGVAFYMKLTVETAPFKTDLEYAAIEETLWEAGWLILSTFCIFV